jgi:hypothetical protein
MSYIRFVSLILVAAAAPLRAQTTRPPAGPTFGVAVGVSRLRLTDLPSLPGVRGTDVSIGWHAGWQTAGRFAVLLAATSSPYRYAGGGRSRKRAFESITPTVEYRASDQLRLQAGAGLQLDAPVFWDVRNAPGERRFSRGLGVVLGASVTPGRSSSWQPELRARWNRGFADLPEGRVQGQATALLLGVRRDPRPWR